MTPGNQLSIKNDRKIQLVYFSFLEFGHRLGDETFWFTVTAKRSSKVEELSGGMSQLFGIILKCLFVTHAFTAAGCAFTLCSGRRITIHAKLCMFLQGGGAHKVTWHCKGDGGHKFCLLCRNVFSTKSELADVDTDGDLLCEVIKADQLDLATSEDLIWSIRRIHEYRTIDDPTTFDLRQKALGFTYSGYNFMVDEELDGTIAPTEQFCSDWMHCLFVAGVWNITVQLVLKSLQDARMSDAYQRLQEVVSTWTFPARLKQRKLPELFHPNRRDSNNEAKRFKCTARLIIVLHSLSFV